MPRTTSGLVSWNRDPTRRAGRASRLWWALAVCLAIGPRVATATSLFDPALRFRQLVTEHFVIYFHQGEDDLAARLAVIAEDVWHQMTRTLDLRPPRRTWVVLADHTDTPNGWATPVPYNLVVVTASAPSGAEFIGNTSDWLRMVFTHEFTHILHLDQSYGWARGVRRIFGRLPLGLPNTFLPAWQIEGLATFYEGSGTREGRLHALEFREIEHAPASLGGAFPLDRANGGLTAWPSGWAPYAYGVGFHRYLANRFGDVRFGGLARGTARRLPYTGAGSFKRVYGASLGSLWTDYQRSLATGAPSARPPDDGAVQVSRHGFVVLGPRFAPAACAGCTQEILYSIRNPHDFPALMAVEPDGGQTRTLTTRYLGSTSAPGASQVIFDQREVHRNAGLYGDLYVLDRASGRVRRLTREARLADPDVTRDGARLAAVRHDRGRRDLVVAALGPEGAPGPLTVVAAGRGTQFATPRWSPDGRLIAAERRRPGRGPEIVVVDPADGSTRVVATGATRAVTPAWRPDGRALVIAADAADAPFGLFEVDLGGDIAGSPRRLTSRQALWPDVSADGRRLAFIGLTEKGYDVFVLPYPAGVADGPLPPSRDLGLEDVRRAAGSPGAAPIDAGPYRPWPLLVPTSWTPTFTGDRDVARAGLATGMVDPLGYHAYGASVSWLLGRQDLPGRPTRGEPDWELAYSYDRWRPRPFGGAATSTTVLAIEPDAGGGVATRRERRQELGLSIPVRRARWTQRTLLSVRHEAGRIVTPETTDETRRVGLRAGVALDTSQLYGYSISPEDGVSLGLAIEAAGAQATSLGEALTVKGDARAYLRGAAAHHVVALRVAGARSRGARLVRRTFGLGGSAGAPDVLDLGVDAVSLLRGFPADRLAGPNVAALNADYRWPLARVERGTGTWPVFLHTLHAAVFSDVGHAWTDTFRARDLRTSLGVELTANLVAGYALPVSVTTGVAWRRDPARMVPAGTAAYLRLGRAF